MTTTSNHHQHSTEVQKLEEEIETLREELKRLHFSKSAEQDYDIKSRIIDKQTEMIDLLIKERANR